MRFLRNIAIFSSVDIAGLGIGLLVSPITTRLLTLEQYGALPLLAAVWSIVTIIQFAGMDSAFVLYRARGTHDDGTLAATATLVATASAVIVWVLFCVVSLGTPWLSDYAGASRIEVVAFLASVLPGALVAWHLQLLRYMHEAIRFAKVTLTGRVLGVIAAIPVMYYLPQDLRLAGALFTYGAFGCLSYVLAVVQVRAGGIDPHARQHFSKPLVGPMVALGAALIPGALVYSLCAVADRLILGWYSSNAEVAVFALAGAVAGVALVLKAAFSRTWEPYAVDWIATRDERVYLPRLQAAADLVAPFIVVATLLSLVWADAIFAVIFPDAYAGAGRILPVLVLAGMSGMLTLVGNLAELISGRARYRLPVYSIGLAVNAAVCVTFIPDYGAYAAAFGVLAGEVAIVISWIVLGKWLLGNLNLNWTVSWLSLGLSLVLCLAYQPGELVPRWVLGEQLLLTLLCAAAAWMIARLALKKLQVLTPAGTARAESMNAPAGN